MRERFVLRESVWCCFRPRNATPPASPATAAMKREDNSNNFPLAPFPIKYPGKNIFFLPKATLGVARAAARARRGANGYLKTCLFPLSSSSLLLRFFCGNLGNCTKSFIPLLPTQLLRILAPKKTFGIRVLLRLFSFFLRIYLTYSEIYIDTKKLEKLTKKGDITDARTARVKHVSFLGHWS